MMNKIFVRAIALTAASMALTFSPLNAHKLREKGAEIDVADSNMMVIPTLNWNRLDVKVGKKTESWTLDGEQLNDITFFGGIEPGAPLVKEKSKKRDPLPKFTKSTLLIEIPELLEGTYRTYKQIGAFQLLSTEPQEFLGQDGVAFSYEYTDVDGLTRKGDARAAIISGKLYMATFDAPRLHYFARNVEDFRALAKSARLR